MPPLQKLDISRNRFLSGLPRKDIERLRPHLQWIDGPLGDVLYRSNDPTQFVYFPLDAVVSLVTNVLDGRGVELALIGKDGFVGVWGALGADANWHEAVVQAAGALLRIKTDVFRAELKRNVALRERSDRYLLFVMVQISQTAACNRLHRLEQRLARWLLMSHDSVNTHEFQQTHEFLSNMLGSDRSEVTLAAGILRKAGLISYLRGKVKILNRKGLEDASCECYQIVRNSQDQLQAQSPA